MHVILNTDCMEYMAEIKDDTFDCILTDVPYKQEFHDRGMAQHRATYLKIKNYGSNKDLNYTEFFEECLRVLKKVNFFTFCDKETLYDFITMAKEKGFGWQILCFCKTSPTPFTNNQWLTDKEYGIHIFKDLPVRGSYYTKKSWSTMANFKESGIDHPSAKLVKEVQRILTNITDEGDLVFDPFLGSGTTCLACYKTKRHFVGCEINQDYCKLAQQRLDDEQSQLELF